MGFGRFRAPWDVLPEVVEPLLLGPFPFRSDGSDSSTPPTPTSVGYVAVETGVAVSRCLLSQGSPPAPEFRMRRKDQPGRVSREWLGFGPTVQVLIEREVGREDRRPVLGQPRWPKPGLAGPGKPLGPGWRLGMWRCRSQHPPAKWELGSGRRRAKSVRMSPWQLGDEHSRRGEQTPCEPWGTDTLPPKKARWRRSTPRRRGMIPSIPPVDVAYDSWSLSYTVCTAKATVPFGQFGKVAPTSSRHRPSRRRSWRWLRARRP